MAGIRAEAPGLEIGVRVSVFDFVPFQPGPERRRRAGRRRRGPLSLRVRRRRHGPGGSTCASRRLFLDLLETLGIDLVCTTAGSPYYNPHIQRPAAFPPSDGYLPPEDPLVGVARQIAATARVEGAPPAAGDRRVGLFLPAGMAAARRPSSVVRDGGADFIGLGRMVLSYPELPADVLAGRPLARKRHLPHLQRLHDRPAQRPGLGLLSARPVLQGPPRAK